MECATRSSQPRAAVRRMVAVVVLAWVASGVRSVAGDEPQSTAATRQFAVAVGFQTRNLDKLAIEEWRKFLAEFPDDPRRDQARHGLGVCLLRDGQLDAAIAELRGLIADSPRYAQRAAVSVSLGVAQSRRAETTRPPGDFDAALRTFEAVLQEDPHGAQAPRARFARAETLVQAGRLAEAAEGYSQLIKGHPQSPLVPDALYALGVTQDQLKQVEPAARTFAEFLRKYPEHALADECRLRQGEALFALRKFAEAEPLFARAAAAAGFAYADYALLRQAACLLERGQPGQAAALAQTLPKKFPQSRYADAALLTAGKALFLAGQLRPARRVLESVVAKAGPERAEASAWIGRCLLKEKRPAEALKVFDAAPADAPGPVRPLLALGRADALYEMPDRRQESVGLYADFVRQFPDDPQAPQAQYLAALAALDVGQLDAARAHAETFAAKFPAHELRPEALFVAAEADLQARRWPEAAVRYLALVQEFPRARHAEEAKVRRGLALALQGQSEPAEAYLTAELPGLQDQALRAQAHHVIGRTRADRGQFAQAVEALEAALATKPDGVQADETLLTLAYCYRSLGKPADAATRLVMLTTAFPKSRLVDQAYYQLAESQSAQGQLDHALRHYREALRRAGDEPTAPLAQLGIGWMLYRKGDLGGALEALDVVLQKFPRSDSVPRALYAKALTEHRLKRFEPALRDVEAFLATGPQGDEALDARLLRGICQAALGRHEAAVGTLQEIVQINSNYSQLDRVYYEMAFALGELKRDGEAADAFRRLAAEVPASPLAAEAHFRVGEHHYVASRLAEAATAYTEAAAKAAEAGLKEKALHKLGWCAFRRGDYPAGAVAFDRQVGEVPGGALKDDGLLLAAECDVQQQRWRPAYDRLVKVIQDKPPALLARALYRAGQCAGQLQDWTASAAHFGELLAAFPQFEQTPEARYGLAWALQNQGQYPQAIAAYRRVTDETSTETAARAQFMIGECFFLQKDHTEAVRQFLKGAYGYPYEEWVGNCHFEAARCFEILRQLDQARQSYRVLVTKYPTHEKAKFSADRLKALGG